MTEQEFLIQESGLTQEEWNAYVALGTTGKLLSAIKKSMGLSAQALADKVAAENARLDFENRYRDEYLPQMRQVTSDAIAANAKAAAAEAREQAYAKAAKDYGLDINIGTPAAGGGNGNGGQQDPPRAAGSPQDFDQRLNQFSRANSNAIITLNDISAEHFELFGAPLRNSQSLVDEVDRQRTLGHKNFTLRQAWEQAYKVADKRTEISAAAEAKKIADAVAVATDAARKDERSKHSSHPGMRSGQPSRFASYNPNDANSQKPWQTPAGGRRAAMQPWRDNAVKKISEAAA